MDEGIGEENICVDNGFGDEMFFNPGKSSKPGGLQLSSGFCMSSSDFLVHGKGLSPI